MQIKEYVVISWATECCNKPSIVLPIPRCWLQDHNTTLKKVGLVVCRYDANNTENNCVWGGYSAMARYACLWHEVLLALFFAHLCCANEWSSLFCLRHLSPGT
jgi:hypothetical protein